MFTHALVPLDRLDDTNRRLDRLVHAFEQSSRQLDRLSRQLTQMEMFMANEMEDLLAAVENDTTVDQSAITLIEQIVAMLTAAGTDRAKIAEVTAKLRANQAKLAAAVVANTPAAEPPPPPPVEPPPA